MVQGGPGYECLLSEMADASVDGPVIGLERPAYQFDWSHEYARLSGVTTKVKAAHMRLCHSRMQLVQIFPRESQEMVFEAHERAFHFFGGVCRRGIHDNMKTAVSMVFVGKERAYNRRFLELCSHHLVEPVACTPGAGWEKGQVEMRAAFAKTVLVVDEGSLASTVQARDLLRIADALRIPRVVLVGDEKQLDAVDAGKPFAQLQAAGMKTAVMDEILRQRDPERGHGASHARQPDRARSRSRTASALHRRRRQGALEGDPADLRAGGPSSAARCTRGATSRTGWTRASMPASGRSCGRPGSRTTRPRPNGSCATSPAVWSMTHPASRARSW